MRCGTVITITLASLAMSTAADAQPQPPHPSRIVRTPRPAPTPPWWKLATFRVMGGVSNIRGEGVDSAAAWTLDVHAGLRTFNPDRPSPYWIFGADVGVSLGPRGGETRPLWIGGPGVSYGGLWFTVGWSPRLVFGDLSGSTAFGLRNTLSGCTFMGFACVDVSHQFLSTGQGPQNDLRLAFGLDLGMLAQVIVKFAVTRPG
ncbi:MAG: hypothetical protein U0326_21005 [Polyangiales bacterium]